MSQVFAQDLVECIPHLRAFGKMITQNHDQAADLVQDTIVRALRAEHQFTPGTNLKAWLFTIMRNLHVNSLRRRKVRFDSIEDGALDLFGMPPTQESGLEFAELRRGMAKLSPEHREILILVGASGFSYEEAAKICGVAVGTIKSRLSRARTELQALLMGTEEAEAQRVSKLATREEPKTRRRRAPAEPEMRLAA